MSFFLFGGYDVPLPVEPFLGSGGTDYFILDIKEGNFIVGT